MAKCPFATWDEISGGVGSYSAGPFKIVHHTTEGGSYEGARSSYAAKKVDPHFTVAGGQIYQHVDTGVAARALKNLPGGVQTNRDSAVQIEVVGFAGRPKDVTTLMKVAELCRWIEGEHTIPQEWPNGLPRSSVNGRDPGGHNRDIGNWDSIGGHYGHSQVPENAHWDPGYTQAEVAIVTPEAVFDAHDELSRTSAEIVTNAADSALSNETEQIARRLMTDVMRQVSDTATGRDVHIRIRVTAGVSQIELDVDIAHPTADTLGTTVVKRAARDLRKGTAVRRSGRARTRRRK